MLHIVRILAIIFGVLLFLGGLAYTLVVYWAYSAYSTACAQAGAYCTGAYQGALIDFLIFPIIILIFGVIDIVIFMQMKSIENMVDNRQYEAAKSKTLIWTILGFILGGLIIGILLLIAYLKFDAVITWSRNQGAGGYPGQAPAYGAPQQGYQQAPAPQPLPQQPAYQAPPPMAAPPPAVAPAPAVPTCAKCGRPATFVQQYNRYYCYSCSQYV